MKTIKFISFVDPEGYDVWLNVETICLIRRSVAGPPGANAEICTNGGTINVKETVANIRAALIAHGVTWE